MMQYIKSFFLITLVIIILGVSCMLPNIADAQGGTTQLEQEIPGAQGDVGFVEYVQALFAFGLQIIVLTAAIFIVIGSYAYFASGGNAAMAEKGKEIITRTIIGLLLALVGWIILNTISPQFASDLREPQLEQAN